MCLSLKNTTILFVHDEKRVLKKKEKKIVRSKFHFLTQTMLILNFLLLIRAPLFYFVSIYNPSSPKVIHRQLLCSILHVQVSLF